MLPYVPSIIALGLAALVAGHIARSRDSPVEFVSQRKSAATALGIALLVQAAHFAEELATGFQEKLGPLFGFPEMETAVFVTFNLTWILIWFAAIPGVARGSKAAFFAAWFLAIAGILNLVAHPLMAVAAGGYFPGLFTAIPVGLSAVWLAKKLSSASMTKVALAVLILIAAPSAATRGPMWRMMVPSALASAP